MGLKSYKPTSAGAPPHDGLRLRGDHQEEAGEEADRAPIRKSGGRNAHGHITTRHIGGGHKRRYRIIDLRRDKDGVPARVAAIEYDPNRTARIALLHYKDGEKRYILAPVGRERGRHAGLRRRRSDIRPGNCAAASAHIPLGTIIHNVELQPGSGGQMVRTAGSFGQLMAKEGEYAQIRMPSGEVRKVLQDCRATVGQVGNIENAIVRVGKAGKTPLAGHPAHRPRPGHEPGRPPARRRRGQVGAGQPAPGLALGPEDQGPQDPQQPPHRQAHRHPQAPGVRNSPH